MVHSALRLAALKQNISLKTHRHSIVVTTTLGQKVVLNINETAKEDRINYPDNCQTLDVTQNIKIKMEVVKDIQFRFQSLQPAVGPWLN